jgi:hypothetical protein
LAISLVFCMSTTLSTSFLIEGLICCALTTTKQRLVAAARTVARQCTRDTELIVDIILLPGARATTRYLRLAITSHNLLRCAAYTAVQNRCAPFDGPQFFGALWLRSSVNPIICCLLVDYSVDYQHGRTQLQLSNQSQVICCLQFWAPPDVVKYAVIDSTEQN